MPTTIITKSIGTSSRDYSTLQAWEDAAPADLTSVDQIWRGEAYNDSEFTATVVISGSASDATRYKELTTATGQSFADHATKTSNALKYDQSKGVGLSVASYGVTAVTLNEQYARFSKFQVQANANSNNAVAGSSTNSLINQILSDGTTRSTHFVVANNDVCINCIAIVRTASFNAVAFLANYYNNAAQGFHNCTAVRPTGIGVVTPIGFRHSNDGRAFTVKNCASFGFGGFAFFASSGAAGGYNATDDSTATGLTGDITSLTYASQFQNVTDAAGDFRAVGTGSLDGAGTADSSFTGDIDIIGQTRGTPPTIGAWEVVGGGGTDVSVNVTGVSAGVSRGSLAATGDANVSPSGKSATITAGTAAVTGDANVTVTGKLLTISVGTATVSTGVDVNVSVTGVSATITRGTLAATGDANVSPTGVSATISRGTLTVTGDANVSVTGRALAASVGTADVSTAGIDVSVSVTGLAMAAQVGTVSFGPEVTTEAVVVTGGTGFRGARRPRTINEYLVRIGEKDYYFQTMEEAIAFIEAQRVALKPKVEEEAEKTARRILRQRGKARREPVRKPALVKIEAPPGEPVEALNLELQRFERDFDLAIEAVLAREAEIEDVLWIAKHLGEL